MSEYDSKLKQAGFSVERIGASQIMTRPLSPDVATKVGAIGPPSAPPPPQRKEK